MRCYLATADTTVADRGYVRVVVEEVLGHRDNIVRVGVVDATSTKAGLVVGSYAQQSVNCNSLRVSDDCSTFTGLRAGQPRLAISGDGGGSGRRRPSGRTTGHVVRTRNARCQRGHGKGEGSDNLGEEHGAVKER